MAIHIFITEVFYQNLTGMICLCLIQLFLTRTLLLIATTHDSLYAGLLKQANSNTRIDALIILWRENPSFGSGPAGHGLQVFNSFRDYQIGPFSGIDNVGGFSVSSASIGNLEFIIQEYMHVMFGGNNWHSAGGAGNHAFVVNPRTYGLTAQSQSMFAVSGWDRQHLDWKNPNKTYVTSALNEQGNEVPTDSLSIHNLPNGGTFVLRDHVPTGDAIQIKLPHIEWKETGDVKNQYLWLENRRMETQFDEWYSLDCADNNNGQFPRGTPGIYAYVQAGKDVREGNYSDIWSGSQDHRNGLASWIKPLPAEGNFDFHYREDLEHNCGWPGGCCYGHDVVPDDKYHGNMQPNPFTGHNDLFQAYDYDGDGVLYSTGDMSVELGLAQVDPTDSEGSIYTQHRTGDWMDAFSSATGSTELSLSTNPAPVGLYIYQYERRV